MRKTIIFFTLVSCCCGFAMARCLRKEEAADFIRDCLEKAEPGITTDLDKTNRVLKIVADNKYNETDNINQVASQVLQCFANKMEETFPEIKQIWWECNLKTNSERDKRAECIKEEEQKICTKKQEVRSKRSKFSHIDLFMSSAERILNLFKVNF